MRVPTAVASQSPHQFERIVKDKSRLQYECMLKFSSLLRSECVPYMGYYEACPNLQWSHDCLGCPALSPKHLNDGWATKSTKPCTCWEVSILANMTFCVISADQLSKKLAWPDLKNFKVGSLP